MLSSYNLKNKQTIQISGLILQYCSVTTLYRRLTASKTQTDRQTTFGHIEMLSVANKANFRYPFGHCVKAKAMNVEANYLSWFPNTVFTPYYFYTCWCFLTYSQRK